MSAPFNFKLAPYTAPLPRGDTLSITKAGRIGLPRYFVTTRHIAKGTRAELFFDAEHKAIAITFTTNNDPSAYPIGFPRGGGAYINGTRFFHWIKLNPADYRGSHPYEQHPASVVGGSGSDTAFLISLSPRARA